MSPAAPTLAAGRFELDDDGPRLTVTTLLVVQQGRSRWLESTLEAVADQSAGPTRVVVVDASADRMMHAWLDEHAELRDRLPDLSVVSVPSRVAFADIVDIAVDALPDPGDDMVVAKRLRPRGGKRPVHPSDKHDWLWLLHEDSAPSAGSLGELLSTIESSSRIGVAGCKVVMADDPHRLINVGIDVTRTGRHVGASMYGQRDQGQHDNRRDVLAVSSAGMLVRRDVFTALGGFDPSFDGDGDGLDLCWRAHLTGHRVVVVPGAVVRSEVGEQAGRQHDVDRPAPRSGATLRRHRQVALARCAPLAWPFMSLWVLVGSLLHTLVLLMVKRPRAALTELAQAQAPFGLRRILGARVRFIGRATTKRRHLEALFVPAGVAVQHMLDSVRSAVDVTGPTASRAPTETGPVSEDAESLDVVHHGLLHRFFTSPGFWATIAGALAAGWMWRDLLTSRALRGTGNGLVGGLLQPYDTTALGVWRSWTDHWVGAGLGHPNTAEPYLPVLAALAWLIERIPGVNTAASAATAVAWLLVSSVPASIAVAYVSGRVATHARWPRAAAALAWGALATLSGGLAQGRLGPAVAHVLLPAAVAGVVRLGARETSATWAFATCLAVAALGAFAPGLLVALTVLALGVAVVSRGLAARMRGLLVAVLPWLLLWQWTRTLPSDWRGLLAGPGVLAPAGSAAKAWQLALVHPGGPGSFPVLFTLPLVALGLLGLWRCRGRSGVLLAAAILGGLALAVASSHLELYRGATGPLVPWSGPYLDLYAAGLLAAALRGSAVTVPQVDRASTRAQRRRRSGLIALGAVAVLLGAASLAGTTMSADMADITPYRPGLPDTVTAAMDGPRAVRVLVLRTHASGGVTYDLRGREAEAPAPLVPAPALDTRAESVVTSLVGGRSTADLADQLRSLAVGFVAVQGDGDRAQIVRGIESAGALTALPAQGSTQVWRLSPVSSASGSRAVSSSRLTLADTSGPLLEVNSTVQHARSSVVIPPGTTDRVLVVSEGAGWTDRARVTLNGDRLRQVAGAFPTYAVGAAGGRLVVDPGPASARTGLVQGVLWALVAFLAIPFGTRDSRRRHAR